MKIAELFERKKYEGEALEKGGTSIKGKGAAPAIRDLFKKGAFKQGSKILDYGAGKYARNADFLREQGLEVYAYDPYNGTDSDGWEGVSKKAPVGEKFDVAFTSFVLNVVPEHIEDDIINTIRKYASHQIHVTRNMDIFDSVKRALHKKDKIVGNFFVEKYADEHERALYESGELTDDIILDFCHFGVQTSRGFQRIPVLEENGFNLLRKTSGFKVYEK